MRRLNSPSFVGIAASHIRAAFVEHWRSLASYLAVGGTTAGLYFGVFYLIHRVAEMEYQVAASVGYSLAVAFHFFANRYFSFGGGSERMRIEFTRYAGVAAVNYLVMLGTVTLCVRTFDLSPYVGLLAGIGATLVTGYLMLRFWVFRSNRIRVSGGES
jgi:putative flippase GtrA